MIGYGPDSNLTGYGFVFLGVVFLTVFTVLPVASANFSDTKILTPDELEEGMTGYGKTVFYSQSIDTFGVKVVGVLENVMPDQDFIVIKANHPLLKKTKIMSGMSGSPIYINGKLIGALAYSWQFAKESLAGVTPIKEMVELGNRRAKNPRNSGIERIATPMVVSGFGSNLREKLKSRLEQYGFRGRMIAGGQTGQGGSDYSPDLPPSVNPLKPGSAVGIQLMRGDLSMTAIGTVTYRNENTVYAFGHPFMSAGNIRFPMTTAEVITPMPSLMSSFKLASSVQPVGTVNHDGQTAVVGRTGQRAPMVPVNLKLKSPHQNYSDTYTVEVIRNKYLSPGLINMAAANFASSKMNQLGYNRVESTVKVSLKNNKDLELGTTGIVSGSFDPWAFLPIAEVWDNRFQQIRVQDVSVEMTMIPKQDWAAIEDVWLNSNALTPGQPATVFVRLQPYRKPADVRKVQLKIPEDLPGSKAQLTVVPGSDLIALHAQPETSTQLIEYLNNYRKDSQLAVVLQVPRYAMDAAGHDLPFVPYSISGAYQEAHKTTASFQPGTIKNVVETPWVLQGNQTLTLPVKAR